jgi:hypothetical protein
VMSSHCTSRDTTNFPNQSVRSKIQKTVTRQRSRNPNRNKTESNEIEEGDVEDVVQIVGNQLTVGPRAAGSPIRQPRAAPIGWRLGDGKFKYIWAVACPDGCQFYSSQFVTFSHWVIMQWMVGCRKKYFSTGLGKRKFLNPLVPWTASSSTKTLVPVEFPLSSSFLSYYSRVLLVAVL